MKWGLVPYWSQTAQLKYSTINATADKLTTSGVWREPFKHRLAYFFQIDFMSRVLRYRDCRANQLDAKISRPNGCHSQAERLSEVTRRR
jgi:hypothetical protein